MQRDDEKWMREALLEAGGCLRDGGAGDDVPVGAVVVLGGQIIGRGHNLVVLKRDPTLHAEMVAVRDAMRNTSVAHVRLATLFVTLEPCAMCAGALWLCRLERIVFGAFDAKAGACGSVFDIARDVRLNHRPQLRGGVLAEQSQELLRNFFASRRE